MPQVTQRSNLMITILVAVVGMAAGYFIYRSMGAYAVTPAPAAGAEAFAQLKGLTTDFSVLQDERFRSLQVFGELPVNPGIGGKNDLFAPF